MIQLEKRLAALEAQYQADADKAATSEKESAMRRIFKALRDALLGDLGTSVLAENGLSRRAVYPRNFRTHADYLGEVHDRIIVGLATDDDRRVLACMPADDLALVKSTPQEMIALMVEIERAF